MMKPVSYQISIYMEPSFETIRITRLRFCIKRESKKHANKFLKHAQNSKLSNTQDFLKKKKRKKHRNFKCLTMAVTNRGDTVNFNQLFFLIHLKIAPAQHLPARRFAQRVRLCSGKKDGSAEYHNLRRAAGFLGAARFALDARARSEAKRRNPTRSPPYLQHRTALPTRASGRNVPPSAIFGVPSILRRKNKQRTEVPHEVSELSGGEKSREAAFDLRHDSSPQKTSYRYEPTGACRGTPPGPAAAGAASSSGPAAARVR